MSEPKHTPGTWDFQKPKCAYHGLDFLITGKDGEYVGWTYDEVDARFIVKACNLFDDMLRKLKAYKGLCKDDKELDVIIAKAEAP